MTLIKKTTASAALVALTSGLFVNGASADSASEIQAAEKLAAAGIVVKQSNTADYQLGRQVLRQEIAAVARGIAKVEKTSTCTNVFKDVSATKPNTWACYTVEALANAGLIAKNANFRPEANITKAEAVGMIVKARYGNEYNPVSGAGEWQKQVVDFAVSKGIASQFTNYNTPATRGFVFEVAAKTLPEDSDKLLCELFGTCEDNKKPENKDTVDSDKAIQRNENNLKVSLSAQSPSNGMVVANSDRAVLLAFDVNAGNQDVTLRKASLKFTGTGDKDIVKDLAIYSNDVKLTKNDATFNSRLDATLSFDRNIVVKAGETKTLYVTAKIQPGTDTYNQMVRVDLKNLEASATVTGAELRGATLTPYKVTNRAAAEVTTSSATGRLYIGKESEIYNLSVRETEKREDMVVKSISLEEDTGNGVDLDNLSNLALYVNNKKVDATFTYTKSKIVASLNETVKAGQRVNFSVRGEAIDDLNKTLAIKLDNIYAVGATTGVAADTDYGTNKSNILTTKKTVEGTSVNFAFNRTGSNEISLNTTDVKIGELVFNTTGSYTADLEVTVGGYAKEYEDLKNTDKHDSYENIEIDGDSATKTSPHTYIVKNITLKKGVSTLPLTVDIKDIPKKDKKRTDIPTKDVNDLNGEALNFTVKVVKLEDDNLGDKIEGSNLNKVLNNTSLTKNTTVKTTNLTLTAEKVNVTRVVPKGNQEVVLYKGKIDLAGGENITIDELNLESAYKEKENSPYKDQDLNNYISGVTLNIGGKTFSGTLGKNTIDFSSIYAEIQANSKNVELLVTAVLKDKEGAEANTKIQVYPTKISVSADNSKIKIGDIKETDFKGELVKKSSTLVNITSTNDIKIVNNTNDLKDEVLAGSKNVEVASFKFRDTSADIYVNSLETEAKDGTGTPITNLAGLSNVRLMDGTNVLATGTVNGSKVKFEGFTLPQSSKDRTLKIVADLSVVNQYGGNSEAFVGIIKFEGMTIDAVDSTLTTASTAIKSEEVKVVPALVTFTMGEKFAENNAQATIKVTVDAGENDLSKFNLDTLVFNKAVRVSSIKVNNGTAKAFETETVNVGGQDLTLAKAVSTLNVNEEVTNLKTFDIVVTLDDTTSNGAVLLNSINFTSTVTSSDSTRTYEVTSSKVSNGTNMGSYSTR